MCANESSTYSADVTQRVGSVHNLNSHSVRAFRPTINVQHPGYTTRGHTRISLRLLHLSHADRRIKSDAATADM